MLTNKGLRPSVEPLAKSKRSIFHATLIKDKSTTITVPANMGAAMAPKAARPSDLGHATRAATRR